MTKRNGLYIVFEGVVASGKTTQSKKLQEYLIKKYPSREVAWTREPGGGEISDEIRRVVQGMVFKEEMDPVCEAYLYAASRAQNLRNIVLPILVKGGIVVADRSFISSLAFQGAGRGLGIDFVYKVNETAIEGFLPDLVVYIDLEPEIALVRVVDREGDKFENFGLDFFQRVVCGYEAVSEMEVFDNCWLTIDGNGTIDDVALRIKEHIQPYLKDFNA